MYLFYQFSSDNPSSTHSSDRCTGKESDELLSIFREEDIYIIWIGIIRSYDFIAIPRIDILIAFVLCINPDFLTDISRGEFTKYGFIITQGIFEIRRMSCYNHISIFTCSG